MRIIILADNIASIASVGYGLAALVILLSFCKYANREKRMEL